MSRPNHARKGGLGLLVADVMMSLVAVLLLSQGAQDAATREAHATPPEGGLTLVVHARRGGTAAIQIGAHEVALDALPSALKRHLGDHGEQVLVCVEPLAVYADIDRVRGALRAARVGYWLQRDLAACETPKR